MGVVYVLGEQTSFTVGRDPKSDIVLSEPFVSRKHVTFTKITDDAALMTVNGMGCTLNGMAVTSGYRDYVRAGDCIRIGTDSIVYIGGFGREREFVPGIKRPEFPVIPAIEIEAAPPRRIPEKPSFMLAAGPALTMAIPILLGANKSFAVLSSVFASFWAVANVIGRRKKQKEEEKRRKNAYLSYLNECEKKIKAANRQIIKAQNELFPFVFAYLKDGGDMSILWNCPLKDGGMDVRIGRGTIKSPHVINIPKERFAQVDDSLKDLPREIKKRYETISRAPVLAKLAAGTLFGFRLSGEADRQAFSAFILQLCVMYSPSDISVCAQLGKNIARYYSWIPLLPHFREEEDDGKAQTTVYFSDDVTKANRYMQKGYIAVFAGFEKPPPSFCTVINENSDITYDRIPPKLCFSCARALSGLWKGDGAGTAIPEKVPFGKLLFEDDGGGYADEKSILSLILENYEKCDTTVSISAPIGIAGGKKAVELDISEKAFGPHGLVAGTTGSGKSELLSTIIMSFAARFPSDKLAFFLVDYKGGGMSNLFAGLPHVIGNISNLSPGEAKRAMTALRAENTRRQKIFADHGVNSISEYTKMYDCSPGMTPLPHILIIIDEFAELRKEEPEFMDSIISISQVGRSLGMHLILATQKPSGVIDDRIRANSRFRIALRLNDRTDSTDMLGRDDAAFIKECGRACIQVGNNEVFEVFQSGYLMADISDESVRPRLYKDPWLDEELKDGSGDEKAVFRARGADLDDEKAVLEYEGAGHEDEDFVKTWYELTKEAVMAAGIKCGRKKPELLYLPALPAGPELQEDEEAYIVFDDPYERRYVNVAYDPQNTGHILITGRSLSGKSNLADSLVSCIIGKASVYIIDLGGGTLEKYKDHISCGGYIDDENTDDIPRMTGFIKEIVVSGRRSGKGTGEGLGFGEKETDTMVLVVDGLYEVKKEGGDEVFEHLMHILTFGKSAGVFVIATSPSLSMTKDEVLFDTGLFLQGTDEYSVASFLKVPVRDIPQIADLPGRGISVYDKKVLEFQAVKAPYECAKSPPGIRPAKRYPHIPKNPVLDDLLCGALSVEMLSGNRCIPAVDRCIPAVNRCIPAGYDKKSGKIYYLPDDVNLILVSGRRGSGRHTFLFNISITAARLGRKCVYAHSYEALELIFQDACDHLIIIIENITGMLDEFYSKERNTEKEEWLAGLFENPLYAVRGEKHKTLIAGIIDNEARIKHMNTKVFLAMTRHTYGINFGGSLDENRILDFSYIPFSAMQKVHKRCNATVQRYDEKHFEGDILTPETFFVDNSQSL